MGRSIGSGPTVDLAAKLLKNKNKSKYYIFLKK